MDFATSLHPLSATGYGGAKSKVLRKCGYSLSDEFVDQQSLPDDESDEEDDDDDDDDFEDNSNEIPVWVRGEQRWISGLCAETTCVQLVEALLRDDGLIVDDENNALNHSSHRTELLLQYVISEKWRRVEQILEGNTKVLSIWTAWGTAQSEVGVRFAGILLLCFKVGCDMDDIHTHTGVYTFRPGRGGPGTLVKVRLTFNSIKLWCTTFGL